MKNKLRRSIKQKARLSTRLALVIGGTALSLAIVIGWLVFMNFQHIEKTRASGETGTSAGGSMNAGEIILEFTWEKDPVTLATLGPDAIISGGDAHSAPGGRAGTRGLSAGTSGKNINLEIAESELFNQDGIDICVDYRGTEKDGSFISRGTGFNFGLDEGFIALQYKTEGENGNPFTVKIRTDYEVPRDEQFRTYRFIYNPVTGRGEIFVNSAPVWSYLGTKNRPLYWKNSGSLMIGRNLNGDQRDLAILDNLVMRSTGSVSPLAESLISFMLEPKDGKVMIHWTTTSEEMIESFTIERSINGTDFSKVSTVAYDPNNTGIHEYMYTDATPANNGIVYYRIRQYFSNGKFVTHPLSAIRFKTEKNFSIDHISPIPFKTSFDVSYYLPKPGRVWIQLQDHEGKVLSSSTYEAHQGKNVHMYKESKPIVPGTYILNLIFDNKKISAKVIKI